MQFSIIYSVDCPEGEDIDPYAPLQVDELRDQTDDNDKYDYGYLEGCWTNGSRRKWCAILNRDQFDDFIERCGLQAEDAETMGSIGAPGIGIGWAPAISCTSDEPNAIQSAYVTPLPEVEKESFDENDWDRVKSAVVAVSG